MTTSGATSDETIGILTSILSAIIYVMASLPAHSSIAVVTGGELTGGDEAIGQSLSRRALDGIWTQTTGSRYGV